MKILNNLTYGEGMDERWVRLSPDTGGADGAAGDPSGGEGGDPSADPGTGQPTYPGWVAGVREELRPQLADYKTVSDFVEAAYGWNNSLANSIAIPGEDATEEERAAFFEKMGRPKTTEEYEFSYELPGETPRDAELENRFKEFAFRRGLSAEVAKDGFETLMAYQAERIKEFQDKIDAMDAEYTTKLKEAWGDNYEPNLEKANAFAARFDGVAEILAESGLAKKPAIAAMFAEMADMVKDDSSVGGNRGGSGGQGDGWDFPNTPGW